MTIVDFLALLWYTIGNLNLRLRVIIFIKKFIG